MNGQQNEIYKNICFTTYLKEEKHNDKLFWNLKAVFTKDGRGVTYGIYGGLAGMVIVVILTFSSGLLAALVGLATLLGGFNGGTLGEAFRRARRKNL